MVNPHSTLGSTVLCIECSCVVTVIAFIRIELFFLLFDFAIFVCTMTFLGKVLFLANMRRFGKLSSDSSSASVSKEEAETAIEKGL